MKVREVVMDEKGRSKDARWERVDLHIKRSGDPSVFHLGSLLCFLGLIKAVDSSYSFHCDEESYKTHLDVSHPNRQLLRSHSCLIPMS